MAIRKTTLMAGMRGTEGSAGRGGVGAPRNQRKRSASKVGVARVHDGRLVLVVAGMCRSKPVVDRHLQSWKRERERRRGIRPASALREKERERERTGNNRL
jgi:hypothetical protein